MEARNRAAYQSLARGLGIALVVYGHVLRGLTSAGIVHADSPLQLSDYVIYTFHMPLFFLLAGVNAPGSLDKGRPQFLRSKLHSILVPFLVWSLIQGSSGLLFHATTNAPVTLTRLLLSPIFPLGQFWFLQALLICHVLYYLLARWAAAQLGVAAILFAAASAFPVVPSWCPVAFFFLFYTIGNLAAARLPGWLKANSSQAHIAAGFAFFALFVWMSKAIGAPYLGLAALPAAICGVVATLQLCICIERWGAPRILSHLGELSMPIYLMHILVCAAVRVLLLKAGVHSAGAHLVVGTAVGIALPVAVYPAFVRLGLASILFGSKPPAERRAPAGAVVQ